MSLQRTEKPRRRRYLRRRGTRKCGFLWEQRSRNDSGSGIGIAVQCDEIVIKWHQKPIALHQPVHQLGLVDGLGQRLVMGEREGLLVVPLGEQPVRAGFSFL